MKTKVNIVREDIQDLSHYGFDVEDELTKLLSEELAKEIDKSVLSGLGIYTRPIRRTNKIRKIIKKE